MSAFKTGDLTDARAAQSTAVAMVNALKEVGVLPGGKAIIRWMGVDVGAPRGEPSVGEAQARVLFDAVASLDVLARPLNWA